MLRPGVENLLRSKSARNRLCQSFQTCQLTVCWDSCSCIDLYYTDYTNILWLYSFFFCFFSVCFLRLYGCAFREFSIHAMLSMVHMSFCPFQGWNSYSKSIAEMTSLRSKNMWIHTRKLGDTSTSTPILWSYLLPFGLSFFWDAMWRVKPSRAGVASSGIFCNSQRRRGRPRWREAKNKQMN